MQFKKAFISELSAAPYNPRKDLQPPDPEYQRIKRSIEEFGYVDPIIINADYTVIGGHQRLKVLKELGHAQIDVVVVDIPKNKEKALNVALNKISGEWDTQRLTDLLGELKTDGLLDLTGFDDKEFNAMLRELHKDDKPLDSEPQISRAEELRKDWGTELGQMWQCGEHRVICGDCTDPAVVARVMQGEKADLLVTDPPYGVSYAAKNEFLNAVGRGNRIQTPIENDHMKPEAMKDLWTTAFTNIRDFVKAGASYYITGPQGGDLLLLLLLSLKESGFPLRHMLIWAKNNHVLGRSDYHYQHEPIIYGWVDGSHSFYGGHSQTSLWFVDKPHKSDLHPTMKPVALFLKAIQNSTKEEDIILDPFMGSGTTMIASENSRRRAYGLELDPGYIAVILQRYKDTFPDKEIKLLDPLGWATK